MIFQRVNFGYGYLAAPINVSDTQMTLSPGHYLPIDPGPMRLVLWNAISFSVPITDPTYEVVTAYYSGTPNVYNIVRAQEETFDNPHLAGDKVAMTYTKGVSASDLFVVGSYEVDESAIGDKKAIIFDALNQRLVYGVPGAGTVTKTIWVDPNRTDVYTPDGSEATPFKRIADAVAKVIANGDNALHHYLIELAPAVYNEGIILESLALYNLSFHGNGEVLINPYGGGSGGSGGSWGTSSGGWGTSSGGWGPIYGLRSITANDNLLKLRISNIVFAAPFVIMGKCGGNTLSEAFIDNCDFVSETPLGSGFSGGSIELNAINNIIFTNCRSTEPIYLTNVWFSYFESCKLEGDFIYTTSDTCLPASGNSMMTLLNGTILQGAVSFRTDTGSSGGGTTTTFTLVTNASRVGNGSPITVPPEVTIYAQNSFLRGEWRNDGLIILSNSNVQSFSNYGTGTLLIEDQPASQVYNDSSVPGANVKEALDYLNNATQQGNDIVRYAEATLVPAGVMTTMLTFTAQTNVKLSMVEVSGQAYAKFQLWLDANIIGTKRTGPSRNATWRFDSGLIVNNGSIVDVKVAHYSTGDLLDFEASLFASTAS